MPISYVGSVTGINNAPLVLPAHTDRDFIVLFTAGDASNSPVSPTSGFNNTEVSTTPFSRPLGVIPAMMVESVVSDGTMTVIPPNSGSGDFTRIAVIWRGTNFNNPNSALQLQGDNLTTTEPKNRVKFTAASSPGTLDHWYVNFTSIVMNGNATDESGPPGSLTRRATAADDQRIAVYDSNANIATFPDTNGPIFTTGDHEWRSLSFFLYVLDGAYLKETLEDVTLLSEAELVYPPPPIDAVLVATLDDVELDATAHIPDIRWANLNTQLEDVTLDSEVEITLPVIGAELVATLDDVRLMSRAVHGIEAHLTTTLEDVRLESTAQADELVANLTAILDDVQLLSTAQIKGASLVAILDDVRLESKAQLAGANLVAILDDVRLESTAKIKGINANLTAPLEDVVLRSEATITQPQTWHLPTECCTPSICSLDPCALICNFVSILPSGPMWDEPKRRALAAYSSSQFCDVEARDLGDCGTIVDHAVYTALRLYDILTQSLYPALRESNPMTAFDTMDDWLDRLNWRSCVEDSCSTPITNGILPIQILGPCGLFTCQLEYEPCLIEYLKHATIIALTRLQFGGIKNLCFINNVIEPLGAVMYPSPEDESCAKFVIAPTRDTFPKWQKLTCLPQGEVEECLAYHEPNKGFRTPLPDKIFPGLMAAECIVRSMISPTACVEFRRLCEVPDVIPTTCFPEM